MFRNPRGRIAHPVLALLAASALVAGCSADAGSGEPVARPSASAGGTTGLSAAALTTFAQYTGVRPGRAGQAPVRVGFVNSEAGAGAFPEYTVAMKAAVDLLNTQLGGVNGRPVELDACHPADAAQAEQCAQRFAADPQMVAVLHGALDADSTAFHRVLTPKLPVLGGLPLQPSDAQAGNSYYVSSGQFAALGVVTYATTYVKARSVALMVAEGFAATERAVAAIKAGLEAAGVEATVARFPASGTDLRQPVVASGARTADLFVPVVADSDQCVNIHSALQDLSLNPQVLTLAGCLSREVRTKLGDYPRWNYMTFNVSAEATAPDDATAWQLRAFNEWFAPLAARGVPSTAGVMMLQTLLAATKVLASIPAAALSPAAVTGQLKRFTGPVFLGVPRLGYGAIPGLPAIGSLSSRVYVYLGNDNWRDTTAGAWLEPPAPTAPRRT